MHCPEEWYQPDLAHDFELLRSVKDISNKVLENARMDGLIRSSLEAELVLTSNSERLNNLLEKHTHESSSEARRDEHGSVEFSLADLLIVSRVSLNNEGVLPSQGAYRSLTEEVDSSDGVVEVKVAISPASQSGKHKCPRCWKWTSPTEGALCSRCEMVLSTL